MAAGAGKHECEFAHSAERISVEKQAIAGRHDARATAQRLRRKLKLLPQFVGIGGNHREAEPRRTGMRFAPTSR